MKHHENTHTTKKNRKTSCQPSTFTSINIPSTSIFHHHPPSRPLLLRLAAPRAAPELLGAREPVANGFQEAADPIPTAYGATLGSCQGCQVTGQSQRATGWGPQSIAS